jgi:hypothetical protein
VPPTDPDPRPRRSPRGVVGTLLAVVVLGLAAAGLAGAFAGSERQRAVEVVTSSATPSATAAPSPTTPPATAPAVPVAPATPPPAAAPSPTAPVRVAIPGRDVDVPVDPVGVAADGQMEIPPLAERGGWYRFGADPGDPTTSRAPWGPAGVRGTAPRGTTGRPAARPVRGRCPAPSPRPRAAADGGVARRRGGRPGRRWRRGRPGRLRRAAPGLRDGRRRGPARGPARLVRVG